MAIVAYDYEHQNDDELDLKVGMVLQNIQPAIDGWSKGTHEGKTGLFPNNFLFQPANITPPPLPSRSHPPTPSPPSPPSPSPPPLPTKHGTASTVSSLPSSAPPQDLPVEIARAAFEYVADNVDELTIQVGDVMEVLDKTVTDGWWKVQLGEKTGLVPNEFVDLEPLPPKLDQATEKITAGIPGDLEPVEYPSPRMSPVLERVRAVSAYTADHVDELTIQVGDVMEVLDKTVTDGWWKVQLGEKTGLVPNDFVDLEPLPPKLHQATEKIIAVIPGDLEPVEYPSPRMSPVLERVRAVSAYTADHVDELSFQVGDVMEVLDRTEYGWYKVQLGNNTGLVPSSGFVEPLSSDHDLYTAPTGKDEGPHLEKLDITDELAEWKQKCTELERSVQDLERRCRESEQALTTERDKASQTTATLEKRNTTLSDKLTATQVRVFQAERQAKEITKSCEQAETSAQRAEKEILEMQITAELAAKRLQEAEQEIRQAYERALSTEQRVVELTESSELAHRSLVEMIEQGKHGLVELTRRCEQAEQRAAVAEITSQKSEAEKSFWVLSKNEVQLSDLELGRGGWAEVRTGMFRGTEIAVKYLHTVIINPHNRDLFVREMNMASRVRHPNLVQFIGATMEGHPMILLELMPTSLRTVLGTTLERKERVPEKQLIEIAVDVAKALNYLHLTTPHPILHRDISSANVLMEPVPAGWKAKVSDYGSANFAHQLKTRAPGSPAYAAPESLNPRKQSPKMDVFSFGVLLIEMFTHKFPDPDHRDEMIHNVKHGQVVRMIESCLKDEPAHRPTMNTILQQLTSF